MPIRGVQSTNASRVRACLLSHLVANTLNVSWYFEPEVTDRQTIGPPELRRGRAIGRRRDERGKRLYDGGAWRTIGSDQRALHTGVMRDAAHQRESGIRLLLDERSKNL
jgi:hypothetical protein